MDTVHVDLDPTALRAKYDELMAEAERIKRVLDVLPELKSLSSRNGHRATTSPRKAGLRPVSAELMSSLAQFFTGWNEDRFLVPDVLAWLEKHKKGFDAERDRDAVVAGLRNYDHLGDRIVILTAGIGRRQAVYGIKSKLPKDIGGDL